MFTSLKIQLWDIMAPFGIESGVDQRWIWARGRNRYALEAAFLDRVREFVNASECRMVTRLGATWLVVTDASATRTVAVAVEAEPEPFADRAARWWRRLWGHRDTPQLLPPARPLFRIRIRKTELGVVNGISAPP